MLPSMKRQAQKQNSAAMTYVGLFRVPQRWFSSGAVSAFKSEKLQGGFVKNEDTDLQEEQVNAKGPFLSQDGMWRINPGSTVSGMSSVLQINATLPGLQSHYQLMQAPPQTPDALSSPTNLPIDAAPTVGQQTGVSYLDANDPPAREDFCDEQPARDMEAFLQELSLSESSSSHADLSAWDYPEATHFDNGSVLTASYDPLLTLAIVDPAKAVHHFNSLSFEALSATISAHIWHTGPVPDVALFYLFRKVHTAEQSDSAILALTTDREVRTRQGITTPYSEVTSAAVFNALNRTGGEILVVAAAERAFELGLTLSRSNMYHLMKQYSVQGKVEHVEKLFRALEASGKSWNSNCIVIMMLAYFNQGRFEDADKLRRELNSKGIKISERIENRLDKLLSGEEKWRWEDKVFYRPRKSHVSPPPGFKPLHTPIRPITVMAHVPGSTMTQLRPHIHQRVHGMYSQALKPEYRSGDVETSYRDLPAVTLADAVKEPRIHLNVLRSAGFDDLYNVLADFVRTRGPVENVCISFLFRKVETRRDVEKAMEFLKEERQRRTEAGISEEYNETTCSRIFTALFRTGASDLALTCAEHAHETGLVLSGKALHELLKSFAIQNDVEKVEEIWKLVKLNGKPSSRIVYSIFRTYFDNGMMEKASDFHREIQNIGIKLSASATRNIEDVLSGAKRWVRDPQAEF